MFVLPVSAVERLKIPQALRHGFQLEILHEPAPDLLVFETPFTTIQYRFSQKTMTFILKRDGLPVAKLWLAYDLYIEDVVFCDIHLPSNSVWDFDVVVLPKHRLTMVFAILWEQVLRRLADRNVQWVFSRIAVVNRRSTEAHKRLGGKVIGNLAFIKLWNKQICVDLIQKKMSLHDQSRRKKIYLADLIEFFNKPEG
ncbi:MAG: hypothetical protein WHS46_10875 [Desulfosoma sp.]